MRYLQGGEPLADTLSVASMCATDFLQGVVEATQDGAGWARPQRFGSNQRRALSSCLAWHPGLFRNMALCTAGVCLAFTTDASEIALELRVDEEPAATAATLRVEGDEAPTSGGGMVDGVSVVVDGKRLGPTLPERNMVRVSLADSSKAEALGMLALPGLGKQHEVRVWLPCLRGCCIRKLWADGTYVRPLPQRDRLLVLGDELGQGFVCGDPASSWASIVAERFGLELVNQSVAGQVFQPSSISDVPVERVARVVVELGGNYLQERCDAITAAVDARGFFGEVQRHWPRASVCAIAPTWYDASSPARLGSCFPHIEGILHSVASSHEAEVLDGGRLCGGVLAKLPSGADVLDAKGNARFVKGLCKAWKLPFGHWGLSPLAILPHVLR